MAFGRSVLHAAPIACIVSVQDCPALCDKVRSESTSLSAVHSVSHHQVKAYIPRASVAIMAALSISIWGAALPCCVGDAAADEADEAAEAAELLLLLLTALPKTPPCTLGGEVLLLAVLAADLYMAMVSLELWRIQISVRCQTTVQMQSSCGRTER